MKFKEKVQLKTIEFLNDFECGVYYSESKFNQFYNLFRKKYESVTDVASAIFDNIIQTSTPVMIEIED